jgi:lysyl-tRNA synthetase class 2
MTEEGFREREVLKARRETLERLRAKGIEPFALNLESALGVPEPDRIEAIREEFSELGPGEVRDAVRTVAGRVVLRRDMGKLMFVVVRDRSGDLQLVASATDTDPGSFELLGDVDLGDIVGATGRLGTTKKGELSIFVERVAILT